MPVTKRIADPGYGWGFFVCQVHLRKISKSC